MPPTSRSTTAVAPPHCGWSDRGRAVHGRHHPPRWHVVCGGVTLCWRGGGPQGKQGEATRRRRFRERPCLPTEVSTGFSGSYRFLCGLLGVSRNPPFFATSVGSTFASLVSR